MNAREEPLCFVLMPFGTKRDPAGGVIESDAVYHQVIRPAVLDAGMRCVRADEEHVGGIIHKPMYERLLLCDYAVADLSGANANVYYELGIRHAARPWSTVLTYAEGFSLPFDVRPLRALRYHLDAAGNPSDADADRTALRQGLVDARRRNTDSPLFQLLPGLASPDLSILDADAFRDRLEASEHLQERLADARVEAGATGLAAVKEVHSDLGNLDAVEAGVLIDLLLAYRAFEEYGLMVELADQMPSHVARSSVVREQRALALNRLGRDAEAERALLELIADRGPSSEAYGLLGRVYKDRWQRAAAAGRRLRAASLHAQAVDAYLKGFETDWRDPYPGINALQLIWLKDPGDRRVRELEPVVRYGAKQRVASANVDFWTFATMAELDVYAGDLDSAQEWLGKALATNPTAMEASTTLETVKRLRNALDPQDADPWDAIEGELAAAAERADGQAE